MVDGHKTPAEILAVEAMVHINTARMWLLGEPVRGPLVNARLQRVCPRDPVTLKPIEQGASK